MNEPAPVPVVLIGTDAETGALTVVGLYASEEKAKAAVQISGHLPDGCHYAVMTPSLNGFVQRALGCPVPIFLRKRTVESS